MASSLSKTTQDHEEIRRWAEERGGKPSCVRHTGGSGDIGILRIDFPGYTGEDTLEPISWDEWFQKFDERKLALLYQEQTAGGERSNFNKIVSSETAGEVEEGRHESGSRSRRGAGGRASGAKRARKKTASAPAKKSASARHSGAPVKKSAATVKKTAASKGAAKTAQKSGRKAAKTAARKPAKKAAIKHSPKRGKVVAKKKAAPKKSSAKKAAKRR